MKLGLIRGRHEIAEVKDYIFNEAISDVTDLATMTKVVADKLRNIKSLDLYITGLTVATTTVIKVCIDNDIELSLWHYDTATNTYFEQPILKVERCSFCGEPRGNGWYCKHCGAN